MSSAPTSLASPAASSEFVQPTSGNHGVADNLRSPGLFQPLQRDREAAYYDENNKGREGHRRERPGRRNGGGSLNPFAEEFVPVKGSPNPGRSPKASFDSQASRSGGRRKGSSNGNSRYPRGDHEGSHRQSVIFREDLKKSNSEQSAAGIPVASSGGGLSAALKKGGHAQKNRQGSTVYGEYSSMRISGGQPSTSNGQTSASGTPSGSRKGQGFNANHLLNFQYDPIPRPPPRAALVRKPRKPQPYNKELFLQANFRFLVSDFGDYVLNTSDPDKMVEWEDVAAVNFAAPVPVQCPICLDRPLCPQITTCGHIFCFPCVLRYLLIGIQALHVEHRKTCPLCVSMISSKELRTVLIDDVHQHCIGDKINFTLLTRPKGSIIPFEKTQMAGGPLAYSKDGQCHPFSKFTLTSNAEPTSSKAITELTVWAERVQVEGGEDMDLLPFVLVAIDQIRQRKDAWTEHRSMEFLSSSPPVRQRIMAQTKSGTLKVPGNFPAQTSQRMNVGNEDLESLIAAPTQLKLDAGKWDIVAETEAAMAELKGKAGWVYESAFSDDEDDVGVASQMRGLSDQNHGKKGKSKPKVSDLVVEKVDGLEESVGEPDSEDTTVALDGDKKNQQYKKDQEERESYTFYQSTDGQILILHPLNVKCLLHHYGSYESLPLSLEAEIVGLESVTQTELTRKRYRYLSHLPLTAVFQFCEVNLSNLLPESAFSPFVEELRNRENRRQRILKEDQEQKILEHRTSVAGAARYAPPTDADFAAALVAVHIDDGFSSGDLEDSCGTSPVTTLSPPEHEERKLFSNVAKLGFASGYDAPDLMSKRPTAADSSTGSSPTSSSAWTPEAGPSRGPVSFADIIVAQAMKAEQDEGLVVSNKVSSKKGKKASKIIMSTSGGRRY